MFVLDISGVQLAQTVQSPGEIEWMNAYGEGKTECYLKNCALTRVKSRLSDAFRYSFCDS